MTDDSLAAPQPLHRAKVFDGRKEDGSPLVLRQGLTSDDEITRIVGYLKAAPTILFGRALDKDAWSPADPPSVTYYLQKYGMPPEPELLAHIRALNYTLPEVSEESRRAASEQLTGRSAGAGPAA
jgi:hypothetical protein